MSNIVLIGIMGCGKSTIGKLLSDTLSYHFIDADDYLVDKFQMSIPAMFDISEDYFRDHETECLKDFVSLDHTVIAMGGGVVVKERNWPLLKQIGTVIYLDRPIDQIVGDVDTSGRPLLSEGAKKLYALDKERREKYLKACDLHLLNDHTAADAVLKIRKEVQL
jgi:shikimate kinase